MRGVAVALGMAVAGCVSGQVGPLGGLEARLTNSRLVFPPPFAGTETLIFELRADGGGRAIEVLDDAVRGDETVSWRVEDNELCLIPEADSTLSTSGQEECIEVRIEGDVIRVGPVASPRLIGTITPL